ncbi:ribosomal protein L17 [Haliangium ochraceum DSM 14365]|uniref:Large ribosomal subunit protein bL17 n=2 Tax=Haliangium ochraceum TaxID=80816 RepID=D0LI98_HALO1|nr:50S ribosomal protein L17 [Haliangium ochraceum]ACY16477.1 ribosomal protein L17 [Haliangium ochraceum DSM 14365]
MRHRKSGRKLGRTSSHRKALFSNMVASLVTYGRIETTEAKAKELRSIAERTINWGVGVSELLGKEPSQLSKEEQAKLVHARRMAQRVLKNEDALRLLFSEVAPKLAGRPGGYTRVLKTRNRRGDAAPMAFIELVTARAS